MASKRMVAIVTGGNSGIGAATARKLAKNNFALSLGGRNVERLQSVANECTKIAKSDKAVSRGANFWIMTNLCGNIFSTEQVLTTSGDVTDDSHLESLVRRTLDKFGRIDVLVNNAGYWFEGFDPNARVDIDAYSKTFKLNVRSIMKLTDLCEEHLFKSKGNVVNVSSVAGFLPNPSVMSYAMSKAALNMYTQSLALKYAPKGVRVNAVCPGAIDTPLIPDSEGEEMEKMLNASHPIGRIGKANEVAELIAFLTDNKKAGFITGALYAIDGGNVINNALSAMMAMSAAN